jgi:precorrin-2/cobalt-factor-2 C20-methyltransferase
MSGRLAILGMGPGDPELMTLKAARLLAAADTIAFFAKRGQPGHARRIAGDRVPQRAEELRFEYPYTTEIPAHDPRYAVELAACYDAAAEAIGARLATGRVVALLCEGDPFFYGSAMYVFDRLAAQHETTVVPGVTGMSACWSQAGVPIAHGDDVFCVLPGTLDEGALIERLQACDAAVIMKVGRNLEKIRAAVRSAGLLARAIYVERGAMPGERVLPLAEVAAAAPYFSLVLIPGRQRLR